MKSQIWASVWKISPLGGGNPKPLHSRKVVENSQWHLQRSFSQAGAAIYSPCTYHALILSSSLVEETVPSEERKPL